MSCKEPGKKLEDESEANVDLLSFVQEHIRLKSLPGEDRFLLGAVSEPTFESVAEGTAMARRGMWS